MKKFVWSFKLYNTVLWMCYKYEYEPSLCRMVLKEIFGFHLHKKQCIGKGYMVEVTMDI